MVNVEDSCNFLAWLHLNIQIFLHTFVLNLCDGQDMVQEGDTSLQPEPSGAGTSQPLTIMEVNDDEADEAILKLNEDKLRNLLKANSIQCIKGMRLPPKEASRFDIMLCHMIYISE